MKKRELIAEYWEIRWAGPKEHLRVDLGFDAGEPLWLVGRGTMRSRKTALAYWKKHKGKNKYYKLIHVKRYKSIR